MRSDIIEGVAILSPLPDSIGQKQGTGSTCLQGRGLERVRPPRGSPENVSTRPLSLLFSWDIFECELLIININKCLHDRHKPELSRANGDVPSTRPRAAQAPDGGAECDSDHGN